jgi:hypothetical protein
MDFAQDGDLSSYDAEDIADAVMWEGDAKKFLDALVEARYADATEHGIVIHDWYDYAGGLLESKARKREQSRIRVQEYRRRKKEAAAHEGEAEPSGQDEPPQGQGQPGENRAPPVPFAKIMEAYNTICTSFSKIVSIDGKRRDAVRARWGTYPSLDTFVSVFKKAEESDFLKGTGGGTFKADFDWMMKATNMPKILEGKYENGRMTNGTGGKHSGSGPGRAPAPPPAGTNAIGGFHVAEE